jgi:WD40 repeat protein
MESIFIRPGRKEGERRPGAWPCPANRQPGAGIGGRDGTLTQWDTTTGKAKTTTQRAVLGVLTVAYSPDGKTLSTGGIGRKVVLFDPAKMPGE